jgi:hypothetical protein
MGNQQRRADMPRSKMKLAGPEYFVELWQFLRKETSRGVAIVAAAYFDELLAALLGSDSNKFESFGKRIDKAFTAGLISKIEKHDLHVMRELRNDFAHRMRVSRFDKDRSEKVGSFEIWKMTATHSYRKKVLKSARQRLIYVAGCLAARLKNRNGKTVAAGYDPELWRNDFLSITSF